IGKRLVNTRLMKNITIREENATAALEVMSRFAVNPKWLIYLPPTMSPSETSKLPDRLEHPNEAFTYYRNNGVPQVICEAKHMGSRAIVVICQHEDAAKERFGIVGEGIGVVYTRTGRRFFNDADLEAAFLARVRDAISNAGLWDELNTSWMLLDCELMPWSAKAQELLQTQYAAVGAAAGSALQAATSALDAAIGRGLDAGDLLEHYRRRETLVNQYIEAYRRYCWEVNTLDDLTLAPFHLLATEGAVHIDKDHLWHMQMLARVCDQDEGLLLKTEHKVVDVTDEASITE